MLQYGQRCLYVRGFVVWNGNSTVDRVVILCSCLRIRSLYVGRVRPRIRLNKRGKLFCLDDLVLVIFRARTQGTFTKYGEVEGRVRIGNNREHVTRKGKR